MPPTVVQGLPGYKATKRKLTEVERRCHLRQVREFTREADFFAAIHEPSLRYTPGKVRKGTFATFCEAQSTATVPGVRLRPKGFRPDDEGGEGWACQSVKRRNEKGRYGLRFAAKSWVEHLAWTLEPFKSRLGFWTVTVPTCALRQLKEIESGWARFSARLHQELTRRLQTKGLPKGAAKRVAWWLSVTEIQPERSKQLQMPCGHLHIVFVGKEAGKNKPWILTPEDFDDIIYVSLKSAGVQLPESKQEIQELLKAAGNVKRVKKSVEKYLGKYMTKSGAEIAGWNDPAVAGGLYVKQWWHRSDPLAVRGKAHMPVLHGDFGWWCSGKRGLLESLGLLSVRDFEAEDFRPAGIGVRAMRRDGIQIAWNLWRDLAWAEDGEKNPYVPKMLHSSMWRNWAYRHGTPSLSRPVRVGRGRDEASVLTVSIPTSNLEADNVTSSVIDGVGSSLTEICKERLELVYREVDIPEPVFVARGSIGVKCQLELPLGRLDVGSAWDVGASDSWDPYWDDPNWRGGPPR